jgi:hypothetical protein
MTKALHGHGFEDVAGLLQTVPWKVEARWVLVHEEAGSIKCLSSIFLCVELTLRKRVQDTQRQRSEEGKSQLQGPDQVYGHRHTGM